MKLSNLIGQVVLAVAIIVLYVLHFTGAEKAPVQASTETASVSVMPGNEIVYVNIDTVLANYDLYYEIQTNLQSKLKTSEARLMSKQEDYRKKVEDYQYKVQRGLVTTSDRKEIEQSLMQEEQSLMQLQNQLQMQLAEEEQVAQRKVIYSIMDYLEKDESINKNQYVMGTTFGGNILYANGNLNVTRKVIDGLNEQYKKEKE